MAEGTRGSAGRGVSPLMVLQDSGNRVHSPVMARKTADVLQCDGKENNGLRVPKDVRHRTPTPHSMVVISVDDDDEDEVFFGDITKEEKAKAKKLKGRRRTMVYDPSKSREDDNDEKEDITKEKERLQAAIRIQATVRGYLQKTVYVNRKCAARTIQRAWRASVECRKPATVEPNISLPQQEAKDHSTSFIPVVSDDSHSKPSSGRKIVAPVPKLVAPVAVKPDESSKSGLALQTSDLEEKRAKLEKIREERRRLERLVQMRGGKDDTPKLSTPRKSKFTVTESPVRQSSSIPRSPSPNAAGLLASTTTTASGPSSNLSTTFTAPTGDSLSLPSLSLGGFRSFHSMSEQAQKEREMMRVTRMNTIHNSRTVVNVIHPRDAWLVSSTKNIFNNQDNNGRTNSCSHVATIRWSEELTTDQPEDPSKLIAKGKSSLKVRPPDSKFPFASDKISGTIILDAK